MSVLAITEAELARSHGTGAQVLQIFAKEEFHHFYWRIGHGRVSEIPNSTLLVDWVPPIHTVGRCVRQLRRWSGTAWWDEDRVNARRLRRLAEAMRLRLDVGYVVVARENDAARALSIVRVLGVPYIVNVVDILDDRGLDGTRTPAFKQLLSGASGLMSLLPSITRELRKLTDAPIEEVSVGKPVSRWVARPPRPGEPIRIVMGGRPYEDGCRTFAEAWGQFKHTAAEFELLYVGPHYHDIPDELRQMFQNVGFIAEESRYQEFLASAHLALVSGPNRLDQYGRWSFPSRTADYLMAGLPLLACVAPGTATEEVLRPIAADAVQYIRGHEDLSQARERFTRTPDAWQAASRTVRSFAERTMSLDVVTAQVLGHLRSAVTLGRLNIQMNT